MNGGFVWSSPTVWSGMPPIPGTRYSTERSTSRRYIAVRKTGWTKTRSGTSVGRSAASPPHAGIHHRPDRRPRIERGLRLRDQPADAVVVAARTRSPPSPPAAGLRARSRACRRRRRSGRRSCGPASRPGPGAPWEPAEPALPERARAVCWHPGGHRRDRRPGHPARRSEARALRSTPAPAGGSASAHVPTNPTASRITRSVTSSAVLVDAADPTDRNPGAFRVTRRNAPLRRPSGRGEAAARPAAVSPGATASRAIAGPATWRNAASVRVSKRGSRRTGDLPRRAGSPQDRDGGPRVGRELPGPRHQRLLVAPDDGRCRSPRPPGWRATVLSSSSQTGDAPTRRGCSRRPAWLIAYAGGPTTGSSLNAS